MGKSKTVHRYPLILLCGQVDSIFVANEDMTNYRVLDSLRNLRSVRNVEDVDQNSAAKAWSWVLASNRLDVEHKKMVTIPKVRVIEKTLLGLDRTVVLWPFLARVTGKRLCGQAGFIPAEKHLYFKSGALNADKLKQLLNCAA